MGSLPDSLFRIRSNTPWITGCNGIRLSSSLLAVDQGRLRSKKTTSGYAVSFLNCIVEKLPNIELVFAFCL